MWSLIGGNFLYPHLYRRRPAGTGGTVVHGHREQPGKLAREPPLPARRQIRRPYPGLAPPGGGARLEEELKALSASGLSVRVTPAGSAAAPGAGRAITLTVIGPDRLGIVREISRALAQCQVNVVEMDSHVTSAAMSGEMIFQARIDAEIPASLELDDLHDRLDEIANHMTLEIDLEKAG